VAASAIESISAQRLDPITFPLSGSRLIEASAGTGKTFTIALLYLRLILGHDCAPMMPPQILVTTFTEAAADELRTRIRARLAEAARVFADDADASAEEDAHLAALSRAYVEPAARQQAAFRLSQAANWMDEAAIFTIHSWCQRMLSSHAFHSRALFEQTVLTSLAPTIDRIVQDYWRIHVYAAPPAHAVLAARCLNNPLVLAKNLTPLLRRDGSAIWVDGAPVAPADLDFFSLIQALADTDSAVMAAQAQAQSAWRAGRAELIAGWLPLLPFLNKTSHKTIEAQANNETLWPHVDAWACDGTPLPNDIYSFLTNPKLTQKQLPPAHPALAKFAAWRQVADAAPTLKSRIQSQLWAHAAYWVRARLNHVLQQQGEMGFDDILFNLADALRGTAGAPLAASLRAQYPVAMIDEFQDTDALQFEIFDRIFDLTARYSAPAAPQAGTVVLIGDPKQSIYRFRGADIDSYLAARRATEGRHDTLTDNYRATPALVAAVNHVFSTAENQPLGAFGYKSPSGAQADNPLPFIAVAAKGSARPLYDLTAPDGAQVVPALTAWELQEGLSQTAFESQMAAHTATAIAQQLNAGQAGQCVFMNAAGEATPITPQDIVVLVSKASQAILVQQALNQRGIKSVYLSDRQNLFAAPEAHDVLRWLRAMAEPHRLSLVRAALGTASLALSFAQLDALRCDAVLDEALARFVNYGAIWQRAGVLAAIYQLLHDYDVPARLLAAPFAQSSGERRLTNVLHLADWAQTEQAQLAGRDALLQRFAQMLSTAQDTEHELRLEQDEHLLRILTIHSAKGLQFPVVYLPFLPLVQLSKTQNKPIATPWRDAADPLGTAAMSLGDFPAAVALAEKARIDEGLRLIYVALTRAESACFMSLGPVKFGNAKMPSPASTPFGYLLGLKDKEDFAPSFAAAKAALSACKEIKLAPPPQVNSLRFTPPPPPPLQAARVAFHRRKVPWRMTSFSGLTAHLHARPTPPLVADSAPENTPETAQQDRHVDALATLATLASHAALDMMVADAQDRRSSSSQTGELALLPRGTEFGTQLHRIFELAGAAGFGQFSHLSACATLVREVGSSMAAGFSDAHAARLATLVQRVLSLPLPMQAGDIALPISLVALQRYQIELEFWLPVPQMAIAALDTLLFENILPQQPRPPLEPHTLVGQIKGFMDLVFESDGRFYVLDYKSNWLGDTDDAYAPDRLAQTLLAARYDVQMVLYLAALHRHLQDRLADYDPALHLGGAFYLFVRGIDSPGAGVYFYRPEPGVLAALDALLAPPLDSCDATRVAEA
jgi:exodeoxyribonuclease V beta subunit